MTIEAVGLGSSFGGMEGDKAERLAGKFNE
jgi:hypothetical protein